MAGEPAGGLATPANAARTARASEPRQIPGWIFVDLTFEIEVQRPKLALAHMSSRFRAGGYTPHYSIGRHRLSYAQIIENKSLIVSTFQSSWL